MTEESNTDGRDLSFPVGCRVQLETSLGEEISGEVAAHDKISNFVVLKQDGSAEGLYNLIGLKTNFVKRIISASFQVREPTPFPDLDFGTVKEKHDKYLQQCEAEWAKFGVDVSEEAQRIYDALDKTMPCKWDQKKIVVLDEVVIDEPYSLGSVKLLRDDTDRNTLDRVKTVLAKERTRLGLG